MSSFIFCPFYYALNIERPTQSVEPSQTTTPSQSPEPTTDPNPTQTTNPDPTQSTEPSQTTTPSQSPDPTTDPNPSETPSPTTPVNPGEGDSISCILLLSSFIFCPFYYALNIERENFASLFLFYSFSGERKSYDKKYIAERRKQIIGRNVPEEKEKQIDVGLYDALFIYIYLNSI